MKEQDYHTSIIVNATAHEVFDSITNVSKWWTENTTGSSQNLNDEFTVRFGDVHVSTQKLVEVIPGKKLVWDVTDCKLNFLKDKQEWINTKISFEILEKNGKTQINFRHIGLVPNIECYSNCTNAWSQYIRVSLYKLLTEGTGMPAQIKKNEQSS